MFARARACAPCVLFIDEIDALVGARSFGSGGGGGGGDVVQGRVLASFLTEMDGISAGDGGVVLVGATNRLEVCHHASLLQQIFTPRTHSQNFSPTFMFHQLSKGYALSPSTSHTLVH